MGIRSSENLSLCGHYSHEGEELVRYVYERSLCPWLWPDWAFALTRKGARDRRFAQFAKTFAKGLIKQKLLQAQHCVAAAASSQQKKAFLDYLMQKLAAGKLQSAQLVDEINTFL